MTVVIDVLQAPETIDVWLHALQLAQVASDRQVAAAARHSAS
jgi:hypothetical protein